MKTKREGQRAKISSQNIVWMIICLVVAVLIPLVGEIYQIPSRFSLPIAIVLLWFGGAIALWSFSKRH